MKSKTPYILLVIFATFLVVGILVFGKGSSSRFLFKRNVQSGEAIVSMRQDEYVPDEVYVKRGTTVRFVNDHDGPKWPASDLHPSHGIYPEFDSRRPIDPGEEWSFTFERVGEWGMHDHLAPYISGLIIVVE